MNYKYQTVMKHLTMYLDNSAMDIRELVTQKQKKGKENVSQNPIQEVCGEKQSNISMRQTMACNKNCSKA